MNPDNKPIKINQIKKPEIIERNLVVNFLKLNPETEETIEIYTKWYDQQYSKYVELGERSPYALDWDVAELYIDSGQYKMAYDKLNEIADVAWMEHNDEWLDKVDKKIVEINEIINKIKNNQ